MDNHQNEKLPVISYTWPPQYVVKDVVRRVTIRQMLEADQMHTTAPFRIDGKEFQKVIIVANVCSFRVFPNYSDFELDDGTGRIRGQQWNNSFQFDPDQLQVLKLPYVSVVGELEKYKDRKSIRTAKIEIVSDPHVLYEHILHAIYDTLVYERGPLPPFIIPQPLVGTDADQSLVQEDDFAEFYEPPESLYNVAEPIGVDFDTHAPYPPLHTSRSIVQQEKEVLGYDPPNTSVSTSTTEGKGKVKAHATTAELLDPISLLGESHLNTSMTSRGEGIPSTSGSRCRGLERSAYGEDDPDELQYPAAIIQNSSESQTLVRPESPMAESPPPSSPPSYPVTPSSHSLQKPSARHDPFSRLTSLQRDILLRIQTVKSENARLVSIYPSVDDSVGEDYWRGVSIADIIKAVRIRYPSLDVGIFWEALETLFEEGYIFTPIDDEHYSCI